MKILLSAASCSPYRGSEPSIGWKVASHLAMSHEVHVTLLSGYKREIEKARAEGLIGDTLHFHFVGPDWESQPQPDREKAFWWKCYRAYLKELPALVRELHRQEGFDVIHHVTFATWRLPVPLHDMGIPFVWGPVGGAEKFPPGLLGILSLKAMLFELVRYAGNAVGRMSPSLKTMVRKADALIASNPDAFELLEKMRGTRQGIHSLLVTSFTVKEREALGTAEKPPRRDERFLHAFASGALEGRKGVSLALDAIALAKKQGLRIRYRVGSHGPEIGHLRDQAKKLGLEEEVIFGEPMPREGYVRELLESDIYLLPSLRDNAPSTLMEAMLAGCVPLVAGCGGPDVIVSDDCGYRVPVGSRSQLVEGVAKALLELQSDTKRMRALGAKARERILKNYTIESYLETTERIYAEVRRAR
jgi:glycosyltransferase involved in cell wall biosynthesis